MLTISLSRTTNKNPFKYDHVKFLNQTWSQTRALIESNKISSQSRDENQSGHNSRHVAIHQIMQPHALGNSATKRFLGSNIIVKFILFSISI